MGKRRCFDPSSTRAGGVGQIDMASLALVGRGLGGKRTKKGRRVGEESVKSIEECTVDTFSGAVLRCPENAFVFSTDAPHFGRVGMAWNGMEWHAAGPIT